MKFYRIASILALAASVAVLGSCGQKNDPDGTGSNEITTENLVGNWSITVDAGTEGLNILADGTFSEVEELRIDSGTWTLDDDVLTLTYTAQRYRDYERGEHGGPVIDENGNYSFTDWQDATIEPYEHKEVVRFYAGGSVLVFVAQDVDIEEGADAGLQVGTFFYRNGKASTGSLSSLEGKWYWTMYWNPEGARAVIIIKGDDGELIITPWGERYTGKVTYENGYLTFHNPAFTTTRYSDDDNPYNAYDHIDEEHPEDSPWRPVNDQYTGGAFEGDITIPVIKADNNTIFSILANLRAVLYKQ